MEHTNVWDGKRLIKEYVKIARLLDFDRYNGLNAHTWPNQIRIKRVAAAICAFLDIHEPSSNPIEIIEQTFDGMSMTDLVHESALSEGHKERISTLLESLAGSEMFSYLKDRVDYTPSDRSILFRVLLRYRIAAEKLQNIYNGVLECSPAGYLGIRAVQNTCFSAVDTCNENIDDILALLLGDKFSSAFTEDELKAKWGYPKETDGELLDWEIDNL